MKQIRTVEARSHEGKAARFMGWLHNLRRMGGINFIILRDGWGTIQAVTEDEADLAPLEGAGLESVISLSGNLVRSPQAPGGVELHQPRLGLITPVHEMPPIQLHKGRIKETLPRQLDHAVIANRHPKQRAIFRLASGMMSAFRSTLEARHFTEVQSPKIVASATESGSNVFELDYFGRPAYLAQSPQFYKQIMVGIFERVFEVGPVFRAEPHDTSRHTNEYVSLDAEFGFIEDHFTVMSVLRDVIAGIMARLEENHASALALLDVAVPVVPDKIPHLHFSQAQELILRLHGEDVRGEPDLSPQDERWLGAWAQDEKESDFLFVTGYPMEKRPFYTHPDPERPDFSNSFDLLFRGTELVTGGQRLHRFQDYLDALEAASMPRDPFERYLEAFRYGMPPHGGFAIGLERFLMQLTGAANLRLTTLFPRDLNRLSP
jgi:nondiscriminating aspartyl-tRNA synthetase